MNFLDFFKPKPQAVTLPTGGFEGATNYSTDRSFIFADPNTTTYGEIDPLAREEILRITRYLVNNYAIVERILTLCENYSVGAGILAQATTKDSVFNDAATNHFDKWASSAFCSVSNEVNLYDLQKLIVREILIAGEVFLVLSKAASGFPQLIPVASEQVRSTGKKSDKTKDGIVYDDQGKAISYQIYFQDKTPTTVDASNVIHLKRFRNLNQKRGVGSFAASLNSLRDTRDLMILEKKSIKVHSSLAATVTKKNGEQSPDGLFGRGVTKTTTTNTATGKVTPNRTLEKAFSGAVAYLNDGESVNLVASDRSTDGFMKFIELLTRDVCMNLSLGYEFVVNPTNLSSAATRFIIQDADFLFKNLQNIVIDGALNRIYSWVTASAINDKKIPNSTDKDWFTVSWVRPQSATIDQGRKDSAELKFVEAGLSSYDNFFSSRGKEWKSELRQVAIEKSFIHDLETQYNVKMCQPDDGSSLQITPSTPSKP